MGLFSFVKPFIICLLLGALFTSCETKDLVGEKEISHTKGSLNEGKFASELDFGGVESVFNVTDSTANISWTHVDGAAEYHIFLVEDGTTKFIQRLFAPAEDYRASNLESNKEYGFIVRVLDEDNLLDVNEVTVTATTLVAPEAPTLIIRTVPELLNDVEREPSFVVFGVNSGDLVRLYSDSSCSTQIGEGTSSGSFVSIQTEELTAGVSYTIYADRYSVNGIDSPCSTVTASYNLLTCPDGYVEVPANPYLSIQSFCVMAYEAKAWVDLDSDNLVDSIEVDSDGCQESGCTTPNWGTDSYKPGSSATGLPWRMLDIQTAKNECQSLGENYDLISNDEWMAIAENIESFNNNWSGGVVGTGCLFQGNIGIDDTCSYNGAAIEGGGGRDIKASHTLSNIETIWDLSGNVAEWVDWGQEDTVSYLNYYCEEDWTELNTGFCEEGLDESFFIPFNPVGIPNSLYDSDYGLGMIQGGPGGFLARGGSYSYLEKAGLFTASFAHTITSTRSEIGFRCVYRTPHP